MGLISLHQTDNHQSGLARTGHINTSCVITLNLVNGNRIHRTINSIVMNMDDGMQIQYGKRVNDIGNFLRFSMINYENKLTIHHILEDYLTASDDPTKLLIQGYNVFESFVPKIL